MIVVVHGDDELSLLYTALTLLERPGTLQVVVLPNPNKSNEATPWAVTNLQTTKPQHTLLQASIHRSRSSLMFLDSVQRQRRTLLLAPTTAYSNYILYHPHALPEYLSLKLMRHHNAILMTKKGPLCLERIKRDLQRRKGRHMIINVSGPPHHDRVQPRLSDVRWIGMHHDLRLPHRVKLQSGISSRVTHQQVGDEISVLVDGEGHGLDRAVQVAEHVSLLVEMSTAETRWSRL